MIPFVDVDPKRVLEQMIGDFENVLGESLLPGDERHMFMQQMAQIIVSVKSLINYTANQNLIINAEGIVLDSYGNQYDVPRLQPTNATTMMRFSLSETQTYDVSIPVGTRVSPDGLLNFYVNETVKIKAGQNAVDVDATAENTGVIYNGFLIGQIKNIVDPIPFVAKTENIIISSGGSDIEIDERYRERIVNSWTKTSTAGSEDSYIYFAKSASTDVADISIATPTAGVVQIYVLAKNGVPDQLLLDKIKNNVNSEKRRPLTDDVRVLPAVPKTYQINLKYYIAKERAVSESIIKESVLKSVNDFAVSQTTKLGGSINPDTLKSMMINAGAFRVDITAPVFTALQQSEFAVVGEIVTEYGGLL